MTKLSHATARLLLAKKRQMTSLIEKEMIAASDALVFDKTDWVPLYLDRGNMVTSDCGTMKAYRALTMKGQPLWMVYTAGKTRGYHAQHDDPFAAMDEARQVCAQRRAVRQNWSQVERTARDLLTGRQRFDILIEDLHASPLCTLGIEGFRGAIGMNRITRMPGWLAAVLMKIEPQMGFVINAAAQRHKDDASARSGEPGAALVEARM